jgi:hypothetical protein
MEQKINWSVSRPGSLKWRLVGLLFWIMGVFRPKRYAMRTFCALCNRQICDDPERQLAHLKFYHPEVFE